ncbi:MAG: creatininase family protein [Nitratireductor sp.]|nr:creatininase family protein [Nitratireductor sp.]
MSAKQDGPAWPKPDFPANNLAALAGCDLSRWIAVLPLGATEQHGLHLPFETDTLIAEGLISRLKQRLVGELPITFLATEPVGYSPEHLDWPGTKSLGFNEAVERWIRIGGDLAESGIRKLLLLNAHGGNSPLMTVVATELRCRHAMLCVATSWTRFGYPADVISPEDAALDIHAGLIETSVMLALHPDKVDMAEARNFASAQRRFLERNRYLAAYGKHAFGWKMQDLNPAGAVGNAAEASAETGEKLLDHAVDGLVALIGEMDRFDFGDLRHMPAR